MAYYMPGFLCSGGEKGTGNLRSLLFLVYVRRKAYRVIVAAAREPRAEQTSSVSIRIGVTSSLSGWNSCVGPHCGDEVRMFNLAKMSSVRSFAFLRVAV